MGKIESVYYRRQTIYKNRRSSCNNTSQNCVWVPKIPTWEKEFCYKIGSFKWEDFLEAKKMTKYQNKVLEWNDSEAEEAFHRAKNRFFAKINNLPCPDNEYIPDPDLYIDKNLDSSETDSDGLRFENEDNEDEEDEVKEDEVKEDEVKDCDNINVNDYVPDYYYIKIEDIKPTGWDIDLEELSREHVLTGLIVGR